MAEDNDHIIGFGPFRMPLVSLSLALMLGGIVVPTFLYSTQLREPTPAKLLVAICISLFSGVVFLWILDATAILRFRAEWIGKSVYGAAIVSVLGTSVAVYKNAFSERQYQYEGEWHIIIKPLNMQTESLIADHKIVLIYSQSADTYW
jgi:hypothetical protein